MTAKPSPKKTLKRVSKKAPARAPRRKAAPPTVAAAVVVVCAVSAPPAPERRPMEIFRRVPRLAVAVSARAPERASGVRDTLREILAQLELTPPAPDADPEPPAPVRSRLRSPFLLVNNRLGKRA